MATDDLEEARAVTRELEAALADRRRLMTLPDTAFSTPDDRQMQEQELRERIASCIERLNKLMPPGGERPPSNAS